MRYTAVESEFSVQNERAKAGRAPREFPADLAAQLEARDDLTQYELEYIAAWGVCANRTDLRTLRRRAKRAGGPRHMVRLILEIRDREAARMSAAQRERWTHACQATAPRPSGVRR